MMYSLVGLPQSPVPQDDCPGSPKKKKDVKKKFKLEPHEDQLFLDGNEVGGTLRLHYTHTAQHTHTHTPHFSAFGENQMCCKCSTLPPNDSALVTKTHLGLIGVMCFRPGVRVDL